MVFRLLAGQAQTDPSHDIILVVCTYLRNTETFCCSPLFFFFLFPNRPRQIQWRPGSRARRSGDGSREFHSDCTAPKVVNLLRVPLQTLLMQNLRLPTLSPPL
jgi:hypothetical protein